MARSTTLLPKAVDLDMARLLERVALAIGSLDSAVSGDFLHQIWRERASWIGYARALQLQSVELDEIDVISWATATPIPGRARFDTLVDPFDAFDPWTAMLSEREQRHWREDLPFTLQIPVGFSDAPLILRAIAILGQHAQATGDISPWLSFPLLLARMGLTKTPLPCLVAGDKAMRLAPRDATPFVRRVLRDLAGQAEDGLAAAFELDAERRRWIKLLGEARKPGALRALAAMSLREPILRPQQVARTLGLSRSGAGKLLDRAAEQGLLLEISGRLSWRVYMAPGLARRLRLTAPRQGRPAAPPALPARDELGASLAAFDAEMAAFAARYPQASRSAPPSDAD
ncbi:MAG: MarR family transcriptional regulator [Sphingomonas sp.]|nr:MarR family transcriptional regulator [Sphingomonas sp.]